MNQNDRKKQLEDFYVSYAKKIAEWDFPGMCDNYHYPHLHVSQLGVTVLESHEQAANFLKPAVKFLKENPDLDKYMLANLDVSILSELFSTIEATIKCMKKDGSVDHASEVSYTVANFGEGFKITQILELTIHEESLVSKLGSEQM